ncbi:MAG: hypothetical protein MUF44_03150 [Hydrogenophaga sp.]|jgi:hypothetical protein|nr:hypothetical protein [Hydrogenophaga sp.]
MHNGPCLDDEYAMPTVEALMAGTLALLTGYAQSAPDCAHRPLMAKKVVSNLFFLSGHPELSAPMKSMLSNLRTRWQLEIEKNVPALQPGIPNSLWHGSPEAVQ